MEANTKMNTDYEVYYFDNFIGKYAAAIGKPVVYFRATGWNNSSDVDAINASYALYEDILPIDLWTALKNSEMVFMEVDDIIEVQKFLDNDFPESQETTTTPENYIFYALYNAEGQVIASNE